MLPYTIARRSRYAQLAQSLMLERSTFDAHWRDLSDFLMPRRLRTQTTDRNKGDKRNQKIIDSTGRYAVRTLQSGLHAGLTSPARPWFLLSTPDRALNKRPAVKQWLYEVTERMRSVFQQSNLYNALPIVYGDMGMFGTAAMGLLDDGKDLMRAYTYPLGSYSLGIDERGLVTTFYREYQATVRQVVQDFGVVAGYRDINWTRISSRVKDLWEKGNYEAGVDICWLVQPNEDQKPRALLAKDSMPWSSCYYEKGNNAGTEGDGFLRESGYRTFPILAPRWDVTSHEDSYGTDCPGMTALGDVRQLQSQQKKKAQAINKMVDPPLVGSSQLRSQRVSLLPADITYEDTAHGQQGLRSVHEVRIDLSHLTIDMGEVQYRIKRAFYEDLFLALSSDQRSQRATAREIEEVHEEKLIMLGPVLERTNDELLDPLVDRTFALMLAAGLIPDAPEELAGVKLKVEYVSILAQAQKLVGVGAQDRFLNSVAALAQTFPAVRHKIDEFQVVDNYADMLGVDPRIVKSTDEAQQAAQAEQQQAMQAQQAEQLATVAKAGKDAAATPLDGDTVLSSMRQAAGAAA